MSKVMMSLSVKLKSLLIAAIISLATAYSAFAQVPARPNPPRLVNDFASIFTPEQIDSPESLLTDFANSTSNQIVVVTLNDLGGDVPAQLAFKIGNSWGVGQKSFDNGVVILIKPKINGISQFHSHITGKANNKPIRTTKAIAPKKTIIFSIILIFSFFKLCNYKSPVN